MLATTADTPTALPDTAAAPNPATPPADPLAAHPTRPVHFLPLGLLAGSPFNPRKRFDSAALEKLADSIATHGVQQAIVVRQIHAAPAGAAQFEIVAGERRWRASKIVEERGLYPPGTARIPAFVRELDDWQMREIALTENSPETRKDLHPLDEAQALEDLLQRPLGGGEFTPPRQRGYSVDELAAKIGMSRRYVYNRLQLLRLCPLARDAFDRDLISAKVAEVIASIPEPTAQDAFARQVVDGWAGEPYTHKQAQDLLRRDYTLKLANAPWQLDDAQLLPAAGACIACPKRTGANPELFGDDPATPSKADSCTDIACFKAKGQAVHTHAINALRGKGCAVVSGPEARGLMPNSSATPKGFERLAQPSMLAASTAPLADLLAGHIDPEDITVVDLEEAGHHLVELVPTDTARRILKRLGLLRDDKPQATRPLDASATKPNPEADADPQDMGDIIPGLRRLPPGKAYLPHLVAEARGQHIERLWRRAAVADLADHLLRDDGARAFLALHQAAIVKRLAYEMLMGDVRSSDVFDALGINYYHRAGATRGDLHSLRDHIDAMSYEDALAVVITTLAMTNLNAADHCAPDPDDDQADTDPMYLPDIAEALHLDLAPFKAAATATVEDLLRQEIGIPTSA